MTNAEYRAVMKEAKREYLQWYKDAKRARAVIKKEATKIRKATLTKRKRK